MECEHRRRALVLRWIALLLLPLLVGGADRLAAAAAAAGPDPSGQIFTGVRVIICGTLGGGTSSCVIDTPTAITATSSSPATITAAVSDPAGTSVQTALAVDVAGNRCAVATGAGTSTLTLSCPNGLAAGATLVLTFATTQPVMASLSFAPPSPGTTGPAVEQVRFSEGPEPESSGVPPPAVPLPAGWNLVGGPAGWNLGDEFQQPGGDVRPGPFYTYQAGDSSYQTVAAVTSLPAGVGVWVYFDTATALVPYQNGVAGPLLPIPLPASHWVLVANPSMAWPASVSGADAVYSYDPSTGGYQATTTLQPFQGAWAWSSQGGLLILTYQKPVP